MTPPVYGVVLSRVIEVVRRTESYAEVDRQELVYTTVGHQFTINSKNIAVEVANLIKLYVDRGDTAGGIRLQAEGRDESFLERSIYDWKIVESRSEESKNAFTTADSDLLEAKT